MSLRRAKSRNWTASHSRPGSALMTRGLPAQAHQAISSSGASTVILFQCRFEKMAYTALRCVDFSSISISECLFDRNGSVIALGGSGVGKIRASSLVRSRFGTFYITHGGTQYTVLDVDVASMRSITAHSKLWRDEDRPGQMLVSRRMAISSNIDLK